MTTKNKIQNLNLTSGVIEYRYDYEGSDDVYEDEDHKEEELFFTKVFSNLEEFLQLCSEKELKESCAKYNYTTVWIQSVNFNVESDDKKTKVECIFADENLNNFELIQVA